MAGLIGLFQRGSAYYLRVMLPEGHPLRTKYSSNKFVCSLGHCSYREAIRLGAKKRAEILWNHETTAVMRLPSLADITTPRQPINRETLRDVFDQWSTATQRSTDSIASCNRALRLFEEHAGQVPIALITRSMGIAFKAMLVELPITSKTASDRLGWINSLLIHAFRELELIPKHPWYGLSIKNRPTTKREPWTDEMLLRLFNHPIWRVGELPRDKKAGRWAAYWVPLIGLYTGARCSEICQLRTADVKIISQIPTFRITDEGSNQKLKSDTSDRVIPIHNELLRLGFMDYVRSLSTEQLWPDLPFRNEKAGGYFSQWFTTLRKSLDIPSEIVFHSFRHTFRSKLVVQRISEPVIDQILGHAPQGSIGAKSYTHVTLQTMVEAVQTAEFHVLQDTNLLPVLQIKQTQRTQ